MGDVTQGRIGRLIARYLTKELPGYQPAAPPDAEALARVLQPGDVILIEGATRIASVIKYLTQSTWSHSALYVGDIPGTKGPDGHPHVLIEAEIEDGVVSSPLSKYAGMHVRICRPVSLTAQDRQALIRFALERIGYAYDTKNIFDLMRYLVPLPVPSRFRRRMLALGSGEPTRAICSTLIAQAFESVRYPILPRVETLEGGRRIGAAYLRNEILHIRHHSLYAPRDFDISPYFAIVKPTIEMGFDYKRLVWSEDLTAEQPPPPQHAAQPAAMTGTHPEG